MNPFAKIKFVVQVANGLQKIQEGLAMKNVTKIFGGIISIGALILQAQPVQVAVGGFFGAHPNVSAILAGVGALLALLHNPQPNQ